MKKLLLFASAIGLVLTVNAQSHKAIKPAICPTAGAIKDRYKKLVEQPSALTGEKVIRVKRKENVKIANPTATVTPLGQAVNGLTLLNPNRFIWWDPVTNAISFVRRGSSSAGTSGNEFWLDISTDGGANWSVDAAQIYDASHGNGRHPHSFVYNPSGNTDPNNVYIGWAGAGLDGSNGSWGALNYGVAKADGSVEIINSETSDPANNQGWVTTDDVHITDNGTAYMVSQNLYSPDGTNYTLNGVVVHRGTWGGSDFTWTKQTINHVFTDDAGNAQLYDSKIVFDPTGQIGYISFLGHDDFSLEPDSVIYPIIYKTTDAGATWNFHCKVRIQDIAGVKDYKTTHMGAAALTDLTFMPTFEHSITLDALGNLHIVLCGQFLIADDATFSYYLIKGNDNDQQTIWDIRSNDGMGGVNGSAGSNWTADLVAVPMTATGTLGSGSNTYNMNNWAKVTIDPTRQHIGVTWLDTDTVQWGATNGNYTPDLYARGYSVNYNFWFYNHGKLTANSAVDANVYLGGSSFYSKFLPIGCGGSLVVPYVALQDVNSNFVADPTQINFISLIVDLWPCGTANLSDGGGVKCVNPVINELNITYELNKPESVTLELINLLGENILTICSTKYQSVGEHTISVDVSQLSSGIYFLKSTINGEVNTSKIVKD